ncbi:AVN_HP_G0052740.mRNA.1.CDS.1 [Saccharomyces cerevisiae]|nr:BPG_G0056550.mRNA.1.CDS.1 [Saccharomyces cerevisiae]CAI4911069.1 ANM_HP_G0098960.mRNA.1.CDS.1 [Saccharomyces cerevisiae]CAI4923118.1 ANL_HP_G0196410.mRNA.1.CDS.1 [Saccharomyces cerevisiae]CAI5002093.1 ANM_HP_G0164100.mRNA.1.CDS.1 [Saccharomyces cerevisiae]CAI5010730.1 AVN_HP_G0052740.mRNA.1.CDS.1 [Saccharomyces cerevisiae]
MKIFHFLFVSPRKEKARQFNLSCEKFRNISVQTLLTREEPISNLVVIPMESESSSRNLKSIFLIWTHTKN